MPIQITVDMFSGRPNPTIVLDEKDSAELLKRLRPAKRLKGKPARKRPILGYRGMLVEQVGKPRGRLPKRFRISGGKMDGPDLWNAPADPSVEDFLAGSTGPLRFALPEPILEIIRRRVVEPFPGTRPTPTEPCACGPLYEPSWWNDGALGQRQPWNNCYNYACNYRTDSIAQPGHGSGDLFDGFTGTAVREAAVRDDLIDAPGANNKCAIEGLVALPVARRGRDNGWPWQEPIEGHLVALVVEPYVDYHWYRKGRNGLWTHKIGASPVTDRDNSGNLISDPRDADRGGYTEFVTFMVVKHGHIRIR